MKLQVLCGPISSGKSTYSRNAAQQNFICVNDDSIVNMIHGGDYTLYKNKLKPLYKSIENHIVGIGLAMNFNVLVDRGLNISLKGRQRWLALAHSFDVPCEAIVFKNEGPTVHAKRRFDSDPRGHPYHYWLGVAETHNSFFVLPTIEEGFDFVHNISFEEIQQGKVIF